MIEPARPTNERAGGRHGRRAGIGEEARQRRAASGVRLWSLSANASIETARDLVELALIGDGRRCRGRSARPARRPDLANMGPALPVIGTPST